MTGRHPNRYGTFSPGKPIRAQEVTVAQIAKSAGYATGHFGKWHLNGVAGPGKPIAADDPLSPGKMGFEEWVSVSNYYDLDPLMARNGVTEQFKGDSSDIATDEALKFIRRQSQDRKPFLTVVWFGSPHVPHRALPADKAAYSALPEKDQEYYGELTAVDRSVGRLRAALRELKIADNTIVWYCSDNGGAAGPDSTGNLRGSKGTLWEGGVRVPGIVEWPARIRAPFISEVPCSTLDIFPTVLEAIGAKTPVPARPLDGLSLLPLLEQKMTTRAKAIPFWDHAGKLPGHAALLEWPYKLHTNPVAGRGKKAETAGALPAALLYDVSKDPKETTDLAAQEPERVAKMSAALEAWKASVEKSLAGGDYTN
jgi:arylsulfatase A-like enzyme